MPGTARGPANNLAIIKYFARGEHSQLRRPFSPRAPHRATLKKRREYKKLPSHAEKQKLQLDKVIILTNRMTG